jgi:23S rRNA A2030 N6-methylase RlmJ
MVLRRSDLMSESRQNRNAGNSGDLLKHSACLALLHELTTESPWREQLNIIEAHAGRGSTRRVRRTCARRRAFPRIGTQPSVMPSQRR